MPNKRVYSIIIFRYFPTLLLTHMYLIIIFIFSYHPTRLANFSPLLVYLGLFIYEICSKYPPYSFIRPYSFNWHLRVLYLPDQMWKMEFDAVNSTQNYRNVCHSRGQVRKNGWNVTINIGRRCSIMIVEHNVGISLKICKKSIHVKKINTYLHTFLKFRAKIL